MERFNFSLEKFEKNCLKDDKGRECAYLGFKYSKSVMIKDSEIETALNCLQNNNYKKACFNYGETLGENFYLFKK